jgi:twitching motility protein PilT
MANRLDALIGQLRAQSADAILVEAGNSLFLVKGTEQLPLINAKLTNQHVAELLRDVAPPDARLSIDRLEPVEFGYAGPNGSVRVELAVADSRLFARITPEPSGDVGMGAGLEPPKDAVDPLAALDAVDDSALEDRTGNVEVVTASTMSPPPFFQGRPAIEEWLDIFLSTGASDLHLTSSLPAMIRSEDGEIRELVEVPAVNPWELEQLLLQIMPPRAREEWEQTRDTDFAYDVAKGRLRCNVFCDMRGPAATLRRIPNDIMTVEQLGLPQAVVDLCRLKKGLVLVTGPTGSGKSTTLASMINWINDNRADHIVTVEDPIEYVHTPRRCLIHQRQVGIHTKSYARALRAALREDPDIILVGEMRDLETISIAIEMAETGHLVFGTLHTTTAATTVDRIVDQYHADKQEQVRQMLAEGLKGVISQTLCKKSEGGRVLALEILLVTGAVSNLIREKKTFQIPSVIQTSRGLGMRTLNDSLVELAKSGTIDAQEAIDRAQDKTGVKRDLAAAGVTPKTGVT